MVDVAPSLTAISRWFWALLSPLVAETSVSGTFGNCPRHGGLEAWRLLAEPINDDKFIAQKELLGIVMHPKSAQNMDNVEDAITDGDANICFCS